ncbi:hypothetical protein [Planosporangium mesophilum]|uniref:hypothetical protein n=1 Tax=Planosporangium mesophilum TaxID=689768 RepID=UPI00143A082B|nr:hypothetical protein [Planosporangium mesophilum]NJC82497.1 hypothetical protein [Planosporangium mesophilum]
MPWAQPGDQLVLGRVSWKRPPRPQKDATFWIVLLDKRSHLKAAIQEVTSPRRDKVGLGSHGYLMRAVDRYPWLQGVAGHEVNGSWWETGECVAVFAADATPVTFAAVFPAAARSPQLPEQAVPTAPVALSNLLVALINMGPDGQIYWAERLLG